MGFNEKLLSAFEKQGIKRSFSKGDFLIKEGVIERNIYLVTSGAVRVFYISEFEEHTIRLGYTGSLINSLSSFIKGSPSEFYIEAIRKTEIKSLSKKDLQELINENSDSKSEYIHLLETLVTQQIDREIDLLISSPSERLNRVLQRSPGVFKEVPLKYIAHYLRMKPETLSRIRKS